MRTAQPEILPRHIDGRYSRRGPTICSSATPPSSVLLVRQSPRSPASSSSSIPLPASKPQQYVPPTSSPRLPPSLLRLPLPPTRFHSTISWVLSSPVCTGIFHFLSPTITQLGIACFGVDSDATPDNHQKWQLKFQSMLPTVFAVMPNITKSTVKTGQIDTFCPQLSNLRSLRCFRASGQPSHPPGPLPTFALVLTIVKHSPPLAAVAHPFCFGVDHCGTSVPGPLGRSLFSSPSSLPPNGRLSPPTIPLSWLQRWYVSFSKCVSHR